MTDALFANESEKIIIGTLLAYGAESMEGCLKLRPDMFATANFRLLFQAMREKHSAGLNWDCLEISQIITDRKVSMSYDLSNQTYCLSLTEGTYRHSNLEGHVERLREAWKRRRGAEVCQSASRALEEGTEAVETLSQLQAEVFQVISEASEHEDPHVLAFTIPEWEKFQAEAQQPELSMGMSYGMKKLDELTFGMQPRQVTVVGARSGVGKTLAMCQAVRAVCKEGHSADIFSLEMEKEKILRRLWVMESGVSAHKVRHPHLANISERRAVQEAAFRIAEWPLRIYDKSDMHIDEICARARQGVRQYGSKFVGVDYAQIVHSDGKTAMERVSAVSQKLRRLAKDDGPHVMLLSQLRKPDARNPNNPPSDEDLRETGQIKNDANVVVLLHRPINEETGALTNQAQIMVPKCREGATGNLDSAFNPHSLTFM